MHAMPAHDARHAMFKVPTAALEYMDAERAEGWERLGLLSSLLHDHGRWAEERIWGGPQQSLVHARLSYLLGKELLEQFDVPEPIADQILLATIAHTAGASVEDTMPLRITVSADRAQLLGPEIVIRLLHHPAMESGDLSTYMSFPGTRSVLDRLCHFVTTRIPGPLFSRDLAVLSLRDGLMDVLLLSENESASHTRFCDSRSSDGALLPVAEWHRRWTKVHDLEIDAGTAPMQATIVLSAAHLAPGREHVVNALKKLPGPEESASIDVARALAYVEQLRMTEDARQSAQLQRIGDRYGDDQLVSELAVLLVNHWESPLL